MAISTAAAEDEVTSSLWNEVANLLNGTSGGGQPVSLTQYSSASNWALTARNQGSGGRHQRWLSADGTKTIGTVMDLGARFNTGLIFRVENYHSDPSATPSEDTDYTSAIDSAIAAADTLGGGIVEFGPYKYGFGTINLTNSRATTRTFSSIILRGVRGVGGSLGGSPIVRGTQLVPKVAQGNSDAAKKRALIDCSGATYISIEDMQIGGWDGTGTDTYGSGTSGGTASNVFPALGILVAAVSGFETTRVSFKNLYLTGKFTSAALLVYGASNVTATDCEFYNSYPMTNTPSSTQGGGHAVAVVGRNFANPDLPSSADVAYSNNVTVLASGSYVGAGQCKFFNCQFWARSNSAVRGSALRLTNAIDVLVLGSGAIGSDYACVEIRDGGATAAEYTQNVTIQDSLFSSNSGTGVWGVYTASATPVVGLKVDNCRFSNIENAFVGGVNDASQQYDGLYIHNHTTQDTAPTNGLINLQNSANSAPRILHSDIDCRGLALTTVGGIDEYTRLHHLGTITHGGTGNANKAHSSVSGGYQIGNNQTLYGLNSSGTQKSLLVISSGNVAQVGATDTGTNVVGTSVNLVQAGTSVVLSVTSDTNVTLGLGARATNATVGFPYIPVMAGAASGTPTSISGMAPMVWDTTNLRLRIYDPTAAAWKSVLFS